MAKLAPKTIPTFTVKDARIMFKNFQGRPGPYNREGVKGFAVIIPPEEASNLERLGWPVKYLEPREEGDEGTYYVSVAVRFDIRPPKVVMITNHTKNQTKLTNDTVETLDFADILKIDLIVRAYDWEMNQKSGRKAYLQTMYVTVEEDELEAEYAEVLGDV